MLWLINLGKDAFGALKVLKPKVNDKVYLKMSTWKLFCMSENRQRPWIKLLVNIKKWAN